MKRLIALALLASVAFAAYPNLQLWYRAQDTTGAATTIDCSGNGRNGTISGSKVCATARNQQCWYFDGTGDYVATPSFGLSGTVVVFAAWVRCDSNTTINQAFIGDNGEGATANFLVCYRPKLTAAFWWDYGTGSAIKADTSSGFFLGYKDKWLHVADVCDYTGAKNYIYRNGVLVHTGTLTTPAFPSTARVRYVGSYNTTASMLTAGYMADVQLWTLATMPPLAVMNASVARIAAGLMPVW